MDNKHNWSLHISNNLNKMNRPSGALRFLRRRLDEKNVVKVLTSQYYGMFFYSCQAWLGRHTRKMDIRKISSIHYRLLRIAKTDWKQRKKYMSYTT